MEEKNKIWFLILSFLPILLYAISPLYALVAVVVIFGVAMFAVKDETLFRNMLKPLVLVLIVACAFLALNFVFNVIHGFGGMWNFYAISGFKLFLDKFLLMFNTLLLLVLIGGMVLILIGIKSKKKVFVLDDFIDALLTGVCPFKKEKTKEQKQSKQQSKKQEPEPEIVIEHEDNNQ